MAIDKSPQSVAAAIRQLLQSRGLKSTPRDIIAELDGAGIKDVSPQQVSNEKSRLRKAGLVTDDLPISVIKKVKAFVAELGSLAILKQAIAELEELHEIPLE